jgi:hypothetical protein
VGLAGGSWRAVRLGLIRVGGPGGLGGPQKLVSHPAVGLGVSEPGLAGQAGLVRAVGAGGSAVTLVVGGNLQRGEHGAYFSVGEDDRVVCFRARWSWLGTVAGFQPQDGW